MLSVFDIYELLPRTDCGKCTGGNCLQTAKLIASGAKTTRECTVIAKKEALGEELERYIRENS